MFMAKDSPLRFGKLNNLTAAVLVFLAGALVYHFVVNMRRGK